MGNKKQQDETINSFVVSEQNINPLTENIGGGDDSPNRFERTFLVQKRIVNQFGDDAFHYLRLEDFLESVSESKRKNMEEGLLSGQTVYQYELDESDYSLYDDSYVLIQAITIGAEYFVRAF